MKEASPKGSAKESGWIIEHGAINVVDLSYPIQHTAMNLSFVYPPIIIKVGDPIGRLRYKPIF